MSAYRAIGSPTDEDYVFGSYVDRGYVNKGYVDKGYVNEDYVDKSCVTWVTLTHVTFNGETVRLNE